MYGWTALLFTWNYHNIVNWLGQRSHSPWGQKESDTTMWLTHSPPIQNQKFKKIKISIQKKRRVMGQPDIIHHLMHINLCCITLLKMNPECELSCFSHVQPFVTLWTVDRQGSSVSGILQVRILEWVAMPSSRRSSRPSDWTCFWSVLHCKRVLYH